MKIESNNKSHIFEIEMNEDKSARVWNFLRSRVYIDVIGSKDSDSVETNVNITIETGNTPEVLIDEGAINIKTIGSWEQSSLAASLLAAAELLEPGIVESIKHSK